MSKRVGKHNGQSGPDELTDISEPTNVGEPTGELEALRAHAERIATELAEAQRALLAAAEERTSLETRIANQAADVARLERLVDELTASGDAEALNQRLAALTEENSRLAGSGPQGPVALVLRTPSRARGRVQPVGFVLLAGTPARGVSAADIDKAVQRGDVLARKQ